MANILIIDDEANIRMMLRLALEHVGHRTALASDGDEGLEKFGNGEGWDLILLDQRMPGMEGLQVLKELRCRREDIAVIMITAFGTIDLATEALHAGATDFLRKPFTIEVLRESVAAALSGKPHLPHAANAVAQSVLSFDQVGINGFRLETLPGLETNHDGSLSKTFRVQKTEGAGRACTVVLTASVVEQVKAHLSGGLPPSGNAFWEALCGEALANHLWQNASLPMGGKLIIEELTRGLQRWVEAILVQAQVA